MDKADYDEQRAQGAAQIVAKLREFAKMQGIEITAAVWNRDGSLRNRDAHELVISVGRKSVAAKFSDEQLADYPGRAGTAKTEATLREIARQLS